MRLIDADAFENELEDELLPALIEKYGKEEALNGLHFSFRDVICNIQTQRTVNQWIPCSERLPENKRKKYWVCTDTGYQCECRWTNVNPIWTNLTTDWHWNIFDTPQYTKVVAWMPLPEPYKEDANEQT